MFSILVRAISLLLLMVLVLMFSPIAVYAQDTPADAQATDTVGGLAQWLALLIVFIGGSVGGVVFELLALQGRIELPHRPSADETKKDMTEEGNYAIARHMIDLGIFARVLIGGVAAVIALVVFTPTNLVQLMGVAAVAGSAGTSVFRTIQDRLLATLAQRDAVLARAQTERLGAKVVETEQVVEKLKTVLEGANVAPGAEIFSPEGATFSPQGAALATHPSGESLKLLNDVQRLLNEAKGIGGAF